MRGLTASEKRVDKIVDAIRQLISGRGNNCSLVTLTANSATTTFVKSGVSLTDGVFLFPKTANAATEFGAGTLRAEVTAVSDGKGTIQITHANNAQTDRTFWLLNKEVT